MLSHMSERQFKEQQAQERLTKEQLEQEKQAAARAALRWVRSGMTLGLGTGSTADYFIGFLGERIRAGALKVQAVSSSKATEAKAADAGVSLITPRKGLRLDLTVDGADEIAPDLSLIKGGGGALWREKVVAHASRYFLVIADSSKRVPQLGKFGLPVEVVPFALPWVMDEIEGLGGAPVVMTNRHSPEESIITDHQNYIIDCRFGLLDDPRGLAARLDTIPGIAEHGLFLNCAQAALVVQGSEVMVLRCGRPPCPADQLKSLPGE